MAMMANLFCLRTINRAWRALPCRCTALALLVAGAGIDGAAAQNAPSPPVRIIEQLPTNLPLQPPPARPPAPPPASREVNEPPILLPPGGAVVPFAPPPTAAAPAAVIRQQEALQKRLQDSYEGRDEAIKAMLDPTRIRLLSGYTDGDEAFKALYNNGLEAAEELRLTPGVALTREQVAALRKDIVWQVRIKKNGQELLVPRLYVAKGKIQKN
jgi:hypothetical protein